MRALMVKLQSRLPKCIQPACRSVPSRPASSRHASQPKPTSCPQAANGTGGEARGGGGLGYGEMAVKTEHLLIKAHKGIGEFFCAFSSLERELGQAIKVVLRLEGNAAADTIVGLVEDFGRKA